MEPFTSVRGIAAPLDIDNVDTEVIIRIDRVIQFGKGELGPYCLEAWRCQPDGAPNPDFVLNRPRYQGAQILIAGHNFGCGSSREMAVWALFDMGLRCIIAPSFGDIFEANCFQNGLLPLRLPAETVATLRSEVETAREPRMTVDLERCVIYTPAGGSLSFQLPAEKRTALLRGLDDIGMTLLHSPEIEDFQRDYLVRRPWLETT